MAVSDNNGKVVCLPEGRRPPRLNSMKCINVWGSKMRSTIHSLLFRSAAGVPGCNIWSTAPDGVFDRAAKLRLIMPEKGLPNLLASRSICAKKEFILSVAACQFELGLMMLLIRSRLWCSVNENLGDGSVLAASTLTRNYFKQVW